MYMCGGGGKLFSRIGELMVSVLLPNYNDYDDNDAFSDCYGGGGWTIFQ